MIVNCCMLFIFIQILHDVSILAKRVHVPSLDNPYRDEHLLPVLKINDHVTVYESSGQGTDEISDQDQNVKATTILPSNNPTVPKYNAAVKREVVVVEKTPLAVVIVLIFLTISLITTCILLGVLCRKVRRSQSSHRVPVRIIQKIDDDEYSVMMDWS